MIAYILDSSALIRYVDNEAGAGRVEEILALCASRQAGVRIPAVQWGEVAGNLRHRFGATHEERILSGVIPSEAEIVSATGDRAKRAGEIRVDHGISYADSFAVELTLDSSEHVLVTADYGFKPVADLIKIEFLPAK